jgi:hypothetical protein
MDTKAKEQLSHILNELKPCFRDLGNISSDTSTEVPVELIEKKISNFVKHEVDTNLLGVEHKGFCDVCKELKNGGLTFATVKQKSIGYFIVANNTIFTIKYKYWLGKFVAKLNTLKKQYPWLNIKSILMPFLSAKYEDGKLQFKGE